MPSKRTTKKPRNKEVHVTYLLLGSNVGNRKGWLTFAYQEIAQKIGPIAISSKLYETAPWGKTDQLAFLNQALEVRTLLDPLAVLRQIRKIEGVAGRQRTVVWGPRTLDIDILLYDDQILSTTELTIPHPRMTHRRFVLLPLAEIAGKVIHPLSGRSIAWLLAQCPDQSEVAILAEG